MDDTTECTWRDETTPAGESDEQSQLSTMRWELLRIDGKAAILLTSAGAGAGFALATAAAPHEHVAGCLLVAGLVASAAAILQLLLVVRPRIESGWPYGAEPKSVESSPVERRRHELAVLSALVLAKYRHLRIAVSLLMCALTLVLAAEVARLL